MLIQKPVQLTDLFFERAQREGPPNQLKENPITVAGEH